MVVHGARWRPTAAGLRLLQCLLLTGQMTAFLWGPAAPRETRMTRVDCLDNGRSSFCGGVQTQRYQAALRRHRRCNCLAASGLAPLRGTQRPVPMEKAKLNPLWVHHREVLEESCRRLALVGMNRSHPRQHYYGTSPSGHTLGRALRLIAWSEALGQMGPISD